MSQAFRSVVLLTRFNPIEQAFSKLKALLRKAAARTVDDSWAAIAEIIELFTPTECANFFVNSGYVHALVMFSYSLATPTASAYRSAVPTCTGGHGPVA